ncbi:Uncharacterised protein [Mycobacteroides abscessus subsp. abscessus]|nr:Uncharacterised protein [Mycobacteroides abscessus subsp. abscessus]
MRSSCSHAASSSSPLGTDSTGLPAPTNSARIWPRPGVVISLAMMPAGSEPRTEGNPPTRERRRRYTAPSSAPTAFMANRSPGMPNDPNIEPPTRPR